VRVVIDAERCTGHGRCYSLAPALFSDDERGFGRVIGMGEVTGENEGAARAAALACPEHAVAIEDG
jgi:ferredoxin